MYPKQIPAPSINFYMTRKAMVSLKILATTHHMNKKLKKNY